MSSVTPLQKNSRAPVHAHWQGGTSIVEMMIALTIALVVIGGVMSTVVSTSGSSRNQNSTAQLAEDAQIALSLVAGHLRMAGFSRPLVNSTPGRQYTNYEGASVRGCNGSFADGGVAMDVLTCAAAGQPNAFAIAYEADVVSTLAIAGVPIDCLGQPLGARPSDFGGNFFLAENRFFIRNNPVTGNPELACAGSGGGFNVPQTVISNVEDMRLVFGVSNWETIEPFGNQVLEGRVSSYLTADQIDVDYLGESIVDRWRRISSVRVCLLVRSRDNAVSEATPYIDCAGNVVTPTDRRLRAAVTTTVNLRNSSDIAL